VSDLRVSPANAIQWDAAWASCPHGTAFHSFDPDAAASHSFDPDAAASHSFAPDAAASHSFAPHATAFHSFDPDAAASHSFDPDAAASHVPGARPDTTQAISLSPGFDAVFHIWSKEHRAIINQAHRPGAGPGDESGEEGP